MSNTEFYTPQRQSVTGVLLIFATSLYHLIRNFWALGVYFLVMDPDPRVLFYGGLGLVVVLLITLGYSVLYYLKFLFYIDEEKSSFILQKGVLNSDTVNIPFSKIQQVNFRRNILQRAIGVYSVVIDTAGSQENEVEIKALSKEKADMLAELLMDLSSKEREEEPVPTTDELSAEPPPASPVHWEYKLDLLTLLKLGLTSNYLRGLSILLAFYFTVRSQFNYSEEFPADIPYSMITEMASTAVIILLLLFIGMIITVAETLIKYYGLHLVRSNSGLQVEMGLRNNTRVNIKSRRVQLLQENTNPLQERLNLYKLKISLASSRDSLGRDQIKAPGLSREIVWKVKDYFYGNDTGEDHVIFPHRILLFRRIMRRIFPFIVGWVVLVLFSTELPLKWISEALILVVVLISVFQYFHFKTIQLSVSENFLIKSSGIWNRQKQYIEMYKLQSVSMSQPVWYKRRGLVDITFHSAGGDIPYPLVHIEEIVPLFNYLMYRIESTSKPWM